MHEVNYKELIEAVKEAEALYLTISDSQDRAVGYVKVSKKSFLKQMSEAHNKITMEISDFHIKWVAHSILADKGTILIIR